MKNKGKLVLFAFTIVAGVNQMLWLNFAPIISVIQKKYGVSELTVNGLLLLVFPLLYVVLAVPAGLWIDKKGYRYVINFSTILMSAGAIIRIFDTHFGTIVAGQFLIAVAQPFILTAISKVVGDWFQKEHHALATGAGTIGLFAGMAVGMALTPALIDGTEIQGAMMIFAAVTIAASAFFYFTAMESGQHTPSVASSWAEIREVLANKNLVMICIIAFLAVGFFNSFTTWLELILAQVGMNSEEAGMVGAMIIVGGITGSAIIPAVSDKTGRRKIFVILCAAMAGLFIYPVATNGDYSSSLILAALFGALALPAFAMLLTMSEEEAGEEKAGAATGFLMLAGNAGTIIITVAMEMVKSSPTDWTNAIDLLLIVVGMAALMSFSLKDTFVKSK